MLRRVVAFLFQSASRARQARAPSVLEPLEQRSLFSVSFAPPVTHHTGASPVSILTADVNGDGRRDIVVLNEGTPIGSSSSVSVLLGNGNGTFKSARTTNLLAGASSVVVGDFNGDKHPDLAIANSTHSLVEVLIGNGDGTFRRNPLMVHTVGAPRIAVADFNRDGKLDLAATNSAGTTVSVLLGKGDGTFLSPKKFTVPIATSSLTAADLGNGQVDLVVTNSTSVRVFLGNGDGTFRTGQKISVDSPSLVKVGDFNGDGKRDLFVEQIAGGDGVQTAITILRGNGDGTVKGGTSRSLGSGLIGMTVGDFNGDHKLDFAAAQGFGTTVEVFLGHGDGTFGAPNIFQSGGGPFGVANGDFNGDGRADLASANTFGDTVGVLLNKSTPVAAATTNARSVGVTPALSLAPDPLAAELERLTL